jgi:hypothetical protein
LQLLTELLDAELALLVQEVEHKEAEKPKALPAALLVVLPQGHQLEVGRAGTELHHDVVVAGACIAGCRASGFEQPLKDAIDAPTRALGQADALESVS